MIPNEGVDVWDLSLVQENKNIIGQADHGVVQKKLYNIVQDVTLRLIFFLFVQICRVLHAQSFEQVEG